MKLESLYIADYRVLNNLTLHFERADPSYRIRTQQRYSLDFLAGVNGSGKTTSLQTLGLIFNWLINADRCPVDFDLKYTLGREEKQSLRRIRVTNIRERADFPESTDRLFYQENEGEWKAGKLPQSLLPNAVVIYSTGSELEWEQVLNVDIVQRPETEDSAAQINLSGIEMPGHLPDFAAVDADDDEPKLDEKMIFVRSQHTQLLALCGAIASKLHGSDDAEILAKVYDDIQIRPLAAFTIRVRVHRKLTPAPQQRIISQLESAANRIVANGSDRILQFDMPQQQLDRSGDRPTIFNIFSSPIDLFRHLYSLYNHRAHYEPPLQEISLFFHSKRRISTTNADENETEATTDTPEEMLQLFEWLSDGERSFLARMALFTLFREDDLLILLDEPEVHFNDVWKREIVHTLNRIMTGFASHALITTHSSIALSDVHSTDILVLRRDGQLTNDNSNQQRPGIETFGADPSDILIHVFGTRSANGEHSRRFIQSTMIDLEKPEELEQFSQQIAPGYWRYRIQLEAQRQRQVLQ